MCSSSQVLNLKVRCSRHNDGCQWVGELRHVVPHEREECEWAVVECSYQCGAHLPRRLMAEHEHAGPVPTATNGRQTRERDEEDGD